MNKKVFTKTILFLFLKSFIKFLCRRFAKSFGIYQDYILKGYNDKNRIYLSGTTIMSSKLLVGKEHSRKLCVQLSN